MELGNGDMVLMRGTTQGRWLHSVPKRVGKGGGAGGREKGRINITFRKALVRGGTENYYRYNVGDGGVWRWDKGRGEMVVWEGGSVKEGEEEDGNSEEEADGKGEDGDVQGDSEKV